LKKENNLALKISIITNKITRLKKVINFLVFIFGQFYRHDVYEFTLSRQNKMNEKIYLEEKFTH